MRQAAAGSRAECKAPLWNQEGSAGFNMGLRNMAECTMESAPWSGGV